MELSPKALTLEAAYRIGRGISWLAVEFSGGKWNDLPAVPDTRPPRGIQFYTTGTAEQAPLNDLPANIELGTE